MICGPINDNTLEYRKNSVEKDNYGQTSEVNMKGFLYTQFSRQCCDL